MLKFDKAIIFSPILRSNLLVSFNVKTCGLDVLLFFEFINIVFVFYTLHLQLVLVRHVCTLLNRFDCVVVYFFCDLF